MRAMLVSRLSKQASGRCLMDGRNRTMSRSLDEMIVDLDRFLQLSPIEAGNVLRNLLARTTLHDAAHEIVPEMRPDVVQWLISMI